MTEGWNGKECYDFNHKPTCLECGKPSPTYFVHIKCMKAHAKRPPSRQAICVKRLTASKRYVTVGKKKP